MGHVISEICVEPQAAQTWKYFTQGLKERIVSLDLKGIGSDRVTQVHKWKKVGWHETTKRVGTQFFTFVFNSDVIHVIPWRATISRMALWVAKARRIKNDMMLEALQWMRRATSVTRSQKKMIEWIESITIFGGMRIMWQQRAVEACTKKWYWFDCTGYDRTCFSSPQFLGLNEHMLSG